MLCGWTRVNPIGEPKGRHRGTSFLRSLVGSGWHVRLRCTFFALSCLGHVDRCSNAHLIQRHAKLYQQSQRLPRIKDAGSCMEGQGTPVDRTAVKATDHGRLAKHFKRSHGPRHMFDALRDLAHAWGCRKTGRIEQQEPGNYAVIRSLPCSHRQISAWANRPSTLENTQWHLH